MYNDSKVLSSVKEDVSWPTCSILVEDIHRLTTMYSRRECRCTARHPLPLRCILVRELGRGQARVMHTMLGDKTLPYQCRKVHLSSSRCPEKLEPFLKIDKISSQLTCENELESYSKANRTRLARFIQQVHKWYNGWELTGTMPLVKSVGYPYSWLLWVLSRTFWRLVGSPNEISGNEKMTANAVTSSGRGSTVIFLCEHQESILCRMKVLREEQSLRD